jgi:hypothetical protein
MERCHTYRSLPRLLAAGTGVKIAPNVSRDDGLAFAREAMAGPFCPPETTLQMTKSGRYICGVYLSARFGQLITPRMVRDLCFEQPSNSIQIAPFLRNLLAPYPNLLQKPREGDAVKQEGEAAGQVMGEEPGSSIERFSGTLVSTSLKGLVHKMDSLIEWLEDGTGEGMDLDPDFQADIAPLPSYAWHSQFLPPQPPASRWEHEAMAGVQPPPPMLVSESYQDAMMDAAPPAPMGLGSSGMEMEGHDVLGALPGFGEQPLHQSATNDMIPMGSVRGLQVRGHHSDWDPPPIDVARRTMFCVYGMALPFTGIAARDVWCVC